MDEKVKVSRDLFNRIEAIKSQYSDLEEIETERDYLDELICSSQLSVEENILAVKGYFKGYEVEKTSEEKLLAEYKRLQSVASPNHSDGQQAIYERVGFLKALELANLQIKGVNA